MHRSKASEQPRICLHTWPPHAAWFSRPPNPSMFVPPGQGRRPVMDCISSLPQSMQAWQGEAICSNTFLTKHEIFFPQILPNTQLLSYTIFLFEIDFNGIALDLARGERCYLWKEFLLNLHARTPTLQTRSRKPDIYWSHCVRSYSL